MTQTLKRRIGISLGALLVVASFLAYENSVFAATYTFTQSSWSGGVDGVTVAVHPTNVTNWSKYNSQTGVTAGTTVSLPSTSYTFTDDSATSTSPSTTTKGGGFGNGTNSQTLSTGASVTLSKTSFATPAVATGAYTNYILKSDGTVWSVGYDGTGDLGNNTSYADSKVPVQVSGLTGVIAIAAGADSGYALKSDGTVWAWGANGAPGALGNNSTSPSTIPVQVSGLTGVTGIAAGSNFAYAVKSDGTVWAWGYNGDGEFGNNSTVDSKVPVQIPSFTGVVALAAASASGYALKSDGTVWSWGYNAYGQLGDGTNSQSLVPVQVSGLTGIITISGTINGGNSAYALKSDGTVWSWGYNAYGQLGNNSTTPSNVPVQVSSLTGAIAVSAGTNSAYAVTSDGTVWSWGYNNAGQLGNNSIVNSKVPVQVSGLTGAIAVSAGTNSAYAVKSDGTVWAWGDNTYGQLGNNSTVQSLVPVQTVSPLPTGNLIAMATNATTTIAGGNYYGYAVKSDGTAWAWGNNSFGELGNNSTTNSKIPVQVSNLTGVTAVAGGGNYFGYALKSDGTVWSWGYGYFGVLGNNSAVESNVPVQVSGITTAIAIAGGGNSGYALKSDGTVWAWGDNSYGELGNNSTTQSNAPVQVSGLTGIIAITGGGTSAYALKSDGTVWAWGGNGYGQLGNNSIIDSHVPVQVSGLTGVISISSNGQPSAGSYSAYAVKSDGTVWSWGDNSAGQLGNNSLVQSNVPVQVPGLTGAIAVSGANLAAHALKSDGTVWSWGYNSVGQLGNNSTNDSKIPVQVSGLTGAIGIASNNYFSYAIKAGGTVWAWGDNSSGQLGNKSTTNSSVPIQPLVYQASDVFSAGTSSYNSSGTFTSAAINLGAGVGFGTLALATTLNGQTISVKARSSATSDFSGASAWGTCTAITSGSALSTGGCVTNGQQYIQYQASFSTADTTKTPTLDSVAIGYSQYGTSGSLLSSVYDTGDLHNLIARVTWAETATTSADNLKFQVRSSADNVTWSAWCGYADCSGSTYFTDSSGNGQDLANNHPLRIGNDDRYIQYKVFLASDGGGSPVLNSVSIKYVINAPPDFDPTYGTNGVTVSQDSTPTDPAWGKVNISYSVRDIDTNTGTINPGLITPSFEYSTDNGSTWLAIPSGDLRAADVTNKSVDTSIYTTYSAVWTATSTAPNIFNSTIKVRLTANDNEAANNIGTAVSATIGLDTKAPTLSATFNASTGASTGTVTLATSDDSQLQYRLCNDPSFPTTDAQSNSCAWSTLGGNIRGASVTWTPVKGSDGTETVYVQTRDAYDNLTAQTLVAPATPSNFDLKDVSNPSINVYKEFLSWAPFTATTSVSFASYQIYNSTDGTNFTLLNTITDPALNYYADTVSTGTTTMQYYKVLIVTTQGNISPFTSVLSDLPNGQGGTDTTPPVIDPASIITPAQNLKNSSALVTFTTDELSKGTVQYRKSGTTPWTTVTSLSYVLAHSIYIQGLTPNTLYNVQVSAQDVSGNVSDYVSGPDFTTAGGPVITNVSETSITDTAATIVWNTSTSSDSYVLFSQNQDLSAATTVGSATQVSCTANLCQHTVKVASLAAGVTYYFYVSSTDSQGNVSTDTNGGTYYSFHTTVDTTPPVISAISEPVVSMTAAVIIWTTDEPSTSQVTWGTESGSLTRSTIADLTKTIYHVVTLSSQTNDTNGSAQALTAITPYYFKVNSVDAAGNVAASPEETFTSADAGSVRVITQFSTAANGGTGAAGDTTPPTISAVTADNIDAFSADIHVITSKDTTTFVSYGPTSDYGSIEGNDQLASSKVVTLKRLQEGTTYHYRVKATDQFGTVVSGSDQTFTTIFASEALANLTSLEKATDLQGKLEQLIQSSLPSLAPPFITKPEVSNITESSATITWNTNIKSYGSLRYATDADYLANKNDYKVEVSDGQTESASHSIDLASLEPNTLYHIQARSYVFPQVVGMSPDITFSTKAAAIVPNIVAVKNDGFTVVWQTNDPTSSTVAYRNTKTGERNVVTDEAMKTYHNVQIQNLPSGTTYTVSISGTNSNGNTVNSDGTLSVTLSVDLTPPVISNFKVDNALIPGRTDLIQTVVGWQTDKPANSTVYYQEGAVSGTSASSTDLKNKVESLDSYTTAHIMIIPSLKPGVVYSLKVVSQDQSGNTKVFGPTSIITPKATQSVLDIIVKNFEDTFKFLGAGK